MKPFNKNFIVLAFLSLIIGLDVFAQTQTIGMNEVIELASKSPKVKSAQAMSDSALQLHKADKKRVFMPKIDANAAYTHQLQEQGLILPSINTPGENINLPDMKFKKDMTVGSITLTQPIFDPENMLYNIDASKYSADAQKLTAQRQEKETQGKALSVYLKILELRARRNALEMYVSNLKSRQPEIRRLYEIGYVSESDVLKVKLGIDDANQAVREIIKKEEFLGLILGNLLGEMKTFSPKDLADELPKVSNLETSVDLSKREDLLSLDKEILALEETKKASRARYLPKVAGFAAQNYSDNDILARKDSSSVGIMFTWSIFDGGASLSQAKANALRRNALEQTKFHASADIKAAYVDSLNMLEIKQQEFEERKSAVSDAKRVSDIEFRRLKKGKTTVNNLIDAEDILKDRIEKASLSKVGWYQAWFTSQVSSGVAISAPWEK